jgi:hypothetical protein
MRLRHVGLTLCLVAVAMLTLSPPALGHHKDEHSNGGGNSQNQKDNDGDADSDPNTLQTEETNEPDEGDNMHPSGKDRSVENSWGPDSSNPNQGKSESDPDGTKNGGIDKPNGSGGNDLEDQDGNNGCGNDDDFEDDNNGNCGGTKTAAQAFHEVPAEEEVADEQQVTTEEEKVSIETEEQPDLEVSEDEALAGDDALAGDEVLGETIFGPEGDEAVALGAQKTAGAPDVAAAAVEPQAPSLLPVTGAGALPLLWLALALILTGSGASRVSGIRRRS